MSDSDVIHTIYTEGILLQARIELEGMIAENQIRQHRGESPAYVEKDFLDLRDKHGIHHNGILTNLYGR